MTLPEDREYFSSPLFIGGSTAKPGGSLKNDFWDSSFFVLFWNFFSYGKSVSFAG